MQYKLCGGWRVHGANLPAAAAAAAQKVGHPAGVSNAVYGVTKESSAQHAVVEMQCCSVSLGNNLPTAAAAWYGGRHLAVDCGADDSMMQGLCADVTHRVLVH